MILLCALLLSACGPIFPSSSHGGGSAAASGSAQGGGASSAPTTLAPLTGGAPGPPDQAARPPLPGQSGNPMMPNNLPALQPRGVDLQQLLAPDITDPIERIKRLENAVIEMRRDFDAVLPSIVRLVAVEQDMQNLSKQLGTLLQNEPQSDAAAPGGDEVVARPLSPPGPTPGAASPAPPAAVPVPPVTAEAAATARAQPVPAPAPAAPPANQPAQIIPAQAPAPKAPASAKAEETKNTGLQVQTLRIGEHPDKTRLVLDASGPAAYKSDLDNSENLLIVDLPDAGWAGAKEGSSAKSPLIKSLSVQPAENGKGSRLIIQLKKKAVLLNQSTLKAANGNPFKIIIDLKSAS